jgi:hypothetical protein
MKKLLILCMVLSACGHPNNETLDDGHIEMLAKDFMNKTVVPQMKEPRPYEIMDAKVVVKRVVDKIDDYRFIYNHLSTNLSDSIENKLHLDSVISVSQRPDSIIDVSVNVAYKTKYRLGNIVMDSIKLRYNPHKDKISYWPF